MTLWDVFFLSYRESNCEENWLRVLELHPTAIRLHGIDGIDKAHLAANYVSKTSYFWVVDGDNYLTTELSYNLIPDVDLLMFQALDPLNGKATSLGAVKLWKKNSFINTDMSKGDFTLNSVSTKRVVPTSFSIAAYNCSPYDTWKTAFRHCVKLFSPILGSRDPSKATNIQTYLHRWESTKHSTATHAVWAYQGFTDAKNFTEQCSGNMTKLNFINDYNWLQQYFKEMYDAK